MNIDWEEWLVRSCPYIALPGMAIALIGLVAIALGVDHIGWWVIYFDGKQCS